jgi:hypothetical protein
VGARIPWPLHPHASTQETRHVHATEINQGDADTVGMRVREEGVRGHVLDECSVPGMGSFTTTFEVNLIYIKYIIVYLLVTRERMTALK